VFAQCLAIPIPGPLSANSTAMSIRHASSAWRITEGAGLLLPREQGGG
jgi:hypothetical protein